MAQASDQIKIRQIEELGYRNRYAKETTLHYVIEVPASLKLTAGPVRQDLIETLCEQLPMMKSTELLVGGKSLPFPDILAGKTRGFAWIVSALAAILQRDLYPGVVNFGGHGKASGRVEFHFEYKDPAVGRACGTAAIQIASILLQDWSGEQEDDAEVRLRGNIADHKLRCGAATLNQNLRHILDKADERGIPWKRIARDLPYVQLGQGCKLHRFRETLSDQEGLIATELQRNKILSHRILSTAGLPIPKVALVTSEDQAVQAAQTVGYPVVLKPNSLAKGIGVFIGLQDEAEVRAAFQQSQQFGTQVIMESYIPGDDHRLLVVDGRFVAAAKRLPARIIGDGKRSVKALVAEVNKDPRRSRGYATLMNEIVIDSESQRLLALAGLTLDSVPAEGAVVELKRTANISSGGTAVDVTDSIHPDNAAMAERAARVLGLRIAGVDFLTRDISRSHFEVGGAICEMNAAVGLRPHRVADPNRDIVTPILAKAYPEGDDGRIPIAAVTGTTGKTTTVRMLSQILTQAGIAVGSVTTDETRVAGEIVAYGDLAGVSGAGIVLSDNRCETAVLETARGGIIKRGLAFDFCDVAAMTNIGEDHLGEHGIDSPQEMARVKAKLLQSARKAVVVNANDSLCLAQTEGLSVPRIILAAPKGPNAATKAHLDAGGEALLLEKDQNGKAQLVMRHGKKKTLLLAAAELPSTYNEAALHNAGNALFAAAMAIVLGQSLAVIREGLIAFKPDLEHSPGRLSLVEGLDFELLVDFAHNAAQIATVAGFLGTRRIAGQRICLLTVPGNRLDTHIAASGAAAAGHFDRYICYERRDWLRGRKPGEIAALLRRGLTDSAVPEEAIEAGLSQQAAIQRSVDLAAEGDLVAIFGSASVESVPQFQAAAALKPGQNRRAQKTG